MKTPRLKVPYNNQDLHHVGAALALAQTDTTHHATTLRPGTLPSVPRAWLSIVRLARPPKRWRQNLRERLPALDIYLGYTLVYFFQ